MQRLDFNPEIENIKQAAISIAKADEPDFAAAREGLMRAREMAREQDNSDYHFASAIYAGRIANGLGVVDIREGLYIRSLGASHDDVLSKIESGRSVVKGAYHLLETAHRMKWGQSSGEDWQASISVHLRETMDTWFRATQTAQLVTGHISIDTFAGPEGTAERWMLGRAIESILDYQRF